MRAWLATDTGLKVVAVVIAAFTWFFVKAVTSDTRTVEGVPLEIRVKPGLAVAYTNVRTVNVTVRGTTEDLRQASRAELFAVLDLTSENEPKKREYRLNPHIISHPRRVQVIDVEPPSAFVRIERSAE